MSIAAPALARRPPKALGMAKGKHAAAAATAAASPPLLSPGARGGVTRDAAFFALGAIAAGLAASFLPPRWQEASPSPSGLPAASAAASAPAAALGNGTGCHFTLSRREDGYPVRTIDGGCFPNPLLAIHTVPGLSPGTCNELVAAALRADDWGQKSKLGDLTADIGLEQLAQHLSHEAAAELEGFIGERLSKFIRDTFIEQLPIDGQAMQMKSSKGKGKPRPPPKYDYSQVVRLKGTPFVIKYEAASPGGALAALRTHKDNADVSFILLLSRPGSFDGGGTAFEALGPEPLHLEQGEALVFNGQLVHSALPVTRGRRLVLSGFTYFHEDFLKQTKRLGTLATTVYHH